MKFKLGDKVKNPSDHRVMTVISVEGIMPNGMQVVGCEWESCEGGLYRDNYLSVMLKKVSSFEIL